MEISIIGLIITILSSLITIIGFLITIIQIIKTKKISNNAYQAALEAKSAVKKPIIISELSKAIKSLQEIQGDIRTEKIDLAYLRTKDLVHSLVEIRQLIHSMENIEINIITEIITQLGGILRRQLEVSMNKKESLDIFRINQKLSEYEVSLSELSVRMKFPLLGESK